jgi:protoporphyrinogen oxidase
MKKVGIIGGGITGLTCAYRLARAGHDVEVYEKSDEFGGLAGSFEGDECIFDYGPHEFCTDDPLLVATLEDILGDDLVVREKHVAQYFNGDFIDYPLSPLDVIQQMSLGFIARVGFEVVCQRLKAIFNPPKDESFEQWVSSRFGPTLNRTYFKPYTEKVWGIEANGIDPRTASDRIAFNSVFDYLLKATAYFLFKKNDFRSIHSPLKDKFYYSKRGIGTLCKRLAERCGELGVVFKPGYQLERIERADQRVESLYFTNGEVVSDRDYIVSTMPLTHLLTTMGIAPRKFPIRFRSMVFAFLEIPLPQLSEYSWIYFPDRDICFQRLTDFSHLEAEMVPEGKTGVGFEISCFPEDDIWQASDEEVVQRVRSGLEIAGLLDSDIECKAHVVRRKFIYPIQVTGYLETVQELLEPVRHLRNFVTTGRQGLYKYCNMNECMEMAIDAAEQIEKDADTFHYHFDSNWKGAGLEDERVVDRRDLTQ